MNLPQRCVGRGTRPPLSGEISAHLAESLRESGRGRLFGERTAGKALLHLPAPLEDGSVLLISTARLVRLDGEEIRSGADGSPERATG